MFNHLEPETFIALFSAICVGSYFIGSLLNSAIENGGFGALGNMVILIIGTFFGLYVHQNIVQIGYETYHQAIAGISGAFLCLLFLALMKAILHRIGY